MKIKVFIADYLNDKHAKDIVYLLNNYAEDPMGGSTPLPDEVKLNLARSYQSYLML